jgi:ribosome-associated heat shock protein Hsp15
MGWVMAEEHPGLRIDKWLHHTRVFKTRSVAVQACAKGNVKVGRQVVKAARLVRVGEVMEVEKEGLVLELKVKGLPERRVGAPLVGDFLEDLTPAERREKAAAVRREEALVRPRAHEMVAKPNKQQMREIRAWLGEQ